MYKVKSNNKEIIRFDTKEELILYFARREPITLGLWSESKLLSYIPKLFDQIAMNPNDRYTPGVLASPDGQCMTIFGPILPV